MPENARHSLTMPDGNALVFRTFNASGTPKAAVIIPSAMGVAQKFYTEFARWLAKQGYHVTTAQSRRSAARRDGAMASLVPEPRIRGRRGR